MNHIQWLRLRPARSSASACSKTPPAWATMKRSRLNGSANGRTLGASSALVCPGLDRAGAGHPADPLAVDPAHPLAEGHDRGEPAILRCRLDPVAIVERVEACWSSGQQQDVRAARGMAADADVKILGIEAGSF